MEIVNPRFCTVKNEPPHSYGDCIRACIGTILDRDDVPHCFDSRILKDGKEDGDLVVLAWGDLRAWLKTIKKSIAVFPVEDHVEFMRSQNEGVPYVLLCGTHRGNHAVLCQNGNVIHDPAWIKSEIGLMTQGYYIVCILGESL